jgi:peptidoglycan hydrolase-like protein with peptidoglycan-binding domain
MHLRRLALTFLLTALAATGPAAAAGDPDVAALQVALRHRGLYPATIDGVEGPATAHAVRALQRRAGLAVDGIVGAATRHALGRYGRPQLGKRLLSAGARGWDVAELQFLLAWHGFPSGVLDGRYGPRLEAAVRRLQRWAGLVADGIAGPSTIAVLGSPPPRLRIGLAWPVAAPVGDGFGPRGARFHPGLDLPAPTGTPVSAARAGRVVFAGPTSGGWGNLVKVGHGRGVVSWYAHLSRVDVAVGQRVQAGSRVGLVGSTGFSTGPHLHFEVRIRGAAVDPLPALH